LSKSWASVYQDVAHQVATQLKLWPNLHSLTIHASRANESLWPSTAFSSAITSVGPQLTRLDIHIHMCHLPDLLSLAPWATNLCELALQLDGSAALHGAAAPDVARIASTLIAPARAALVALRLHFLVPVRISYSCVRRGARTEGPAHALGIAALFDALADTRFPRLRVVCVRAPFATTEDEGTPLARFLGAHEVEYLDVAPTPVTQHCGWRSTFVYTAGYGRALARIQGGRLRRVTLHVLERAEDARVLDGVVALLSAVSGTLAEVVITGRALTLDELLTVTHALSHSRDALRMLRIHVECCGPATLALLASWLPRLEDVQLTVHLLCGAALPDNPTVRAPRPPGYARRSRRTRICCKVATSGKVCSSCTTSLPFCAIRRRRRTLRRCSA
jgi:hypothetical protein